MKHIMVIMVIAVLICGCQREDSTPQEIWRGGSIPLPKVETPLRFTVTPTMAVSNGFQQLGPSKQVPVLGAAVSNYYFTYGLGEKALSQAVTIRGKE